MEFFKERFVSATTATIIQIYRLFILRIWHCHLNVTEFLGKLNELLPSTKFTLEDEENRKLSSFNAIIHRKDNGFKYSILRKSTNN